MLTIDYRGKVAVVTGASSGMGQEVARLLLEQGAVVYALDINPTSDPVEKFVTVNLGDKSSIDKALTQLPDAIDSVFACAGVAGQNMPPLLVATINFVGHRYLIESVIPRLHEGSSIGMIASMGGMGWIGNIASVLPLLQTETFEGAVDYLTANLDNPAVLGGSTPGNNRGYTFSKEATVLYAKYRSWTLAGHKIRINTISPGATETPMLKQFGLTEDTGAKSISPIGEPSTPRNQAEALLYINSDAAGYISGTDLTVDYGFSGGIYTGQGSLG